jgi:nitroreductase
MENMWLMAHSLGINFHIVSSFNDGAVEGKTKKILRIPKHLKIAFICRLGYTSTPERYLRVRRDVKDFTSYNQYENKHDS